MRLIPSIPQQIRRAALMGPLDDALTHARLAHSRREDSLLDATVSLPGLANCLRA